MAIIKATFTGNNSLGYVNGHSYILSVNQLPNGQLQIYRADNSGGSCPYDSFISFLKNWAQVSLI